MRSKASSISTCESPGTWGATLSLATDWADYAAHMAEVLDASESFEGGTIARPDWRPVTKYEEEGRAAGRAVTDLCYRRV